MKGQIARGVPEPVARARVDMHVSFGNDVFTPTSDVVESILGRAPIPFARFAQDYAERFR